MPPNDPTPAPVPTIDELVDCALGHASNEVAQRVRAVALRDARVASLLNTIEFAVRSLREDARFEPPAAAVTRAVELSALFVALPARTPQERETFRARPTIGEIFDRASARLFEWLSLGEHGALAGFRDDRGGDLFAFESTEVDVAIRAERTMAEDGVVRLIGEVQNRDCEPVRASVVLLDASSRVLALYETDSLGMFACVLPAGASDLAVVVGDRDGSIETALVLPLHPRADT